MAGVLGLLGNLNLGFGLKTAQLGHEAQENPGMDCPAKKRVVRMESWSILGPVAVLHFLQEARACIRFFIGAITHEIWVLWTRQESNIGALRTRTRVLGGVILVEV